MKKLMLATIAAATLLSGAAVLTQPANAAVRCWWTGPVRHCTYSHPGWWYWHHHRWWWHRW